MPETDEVYDAAKADPVAAVIVEALHAQDARTYNGNAGDIGTLALETAKRVEELVRRDERRRLADLFEQNAETITSFAGRPLELVAFLLRLPHDADAQTS